MEFETGPGAVTCHTYEIDVSVERRMNVFVDQLIPEIFRDDKMNQSKKVMAIDFINRKQVLLSKKANNGANIPYAAQADFKHNVREKLLLLTFKRTYSGPDEYQRKGKI